MAEDNLPAIQSSAAWRYLTWVRGSLSIVLEPPLPAFDVRPFAFGPLPGGDDRDGPWLKDVRPVMQIDRPDKAAAVGLELAFRCSLPGIGRALVLFDALLREHLPSATVAGFSIEAHAPSDWRERERREAER